MTRRVVEALREAERMPLMRLIVPMRKTGRTKKLSMNTQMRNPSMLSELGKLLRLSTVKPSLSVSIGTRAQACVHQDQERLVPQVCLGPIEPRGP